MTMVIAEDWNALRAQAEARLAANPADSEALHALGRIAIDGDVGSDALRQSVLKQAESCVAARPADALCQLTYGQLFGNFLNRMGGLEALGSVSKVQASFEAAAAAAPADFDARESLVTFYSRAPGFVGGSYRKARSQAMDFSRYDAPRAHLLLALIALDENGPAQAEQEMSHIGDAAADADLRRLIAKRWLAIGQSYLEESQNDRAAAAFHRALSNGAPSVAAAASRALDKLEPPIVRSE